MFVYVCLVANYVETTQPFWLVFLHIGGKHISEHNISTFPFHKGALKVTSLQFAYGSIRGIRQTVT